MTDKHPARATRAPRADRSINARAILDVLRARGPSTQADIARATSLSRATVNGIVQALREQNVVEYNWKNKREALVTLASNRGSVISIIVKEKTVLGSLFDFSSQVRTDVSSEDLTGFADEPSSPAMALDMIEHLTVMARSRECQAAGIAIAIEGPIERATGAVAPWVWQRLPRWKEINLEQHFSTHVSLPIVIDNDANLSALAEWTWGSGQGSDDFIYLAASERIGGGIIVGGNIYHGGIGLAGEFGHLIVEDSGDLCYCGSRGCLSSFATEQAILESLQSYASPRASLVDVIQSAQQSDAACQRVLFEASVHLGKALATIIRVMSPSTICVGGTLGCAGEIVLNGLRSCPDIINLRTVGQSPNLAVATIIADAPRLGGVAAILSRLDLGISTLAPWMLEARSASREVARFEGAGGS